MEYYPAAVWSEVIVYLALKLLPFEYRPCILSEVVKMFGHSRSSRVRSRVDAYFYAIYEVEEWLEQSPIQILTSYFFAHD